ncbi:hypothetical protein KJ785_01560 [Patescibacteria group bacterium]|nr:hypothetical protein [Patescibacteria group bacterium]
MILFILFETCPTERSEDGKFFQAKKTAIRIKKGAFISTPNANNPINMYQILFLSIHCHSEQAKRAEESLSKGLKVDLNLRFAN